MIWTVRFYTVGLGSCCIETPYRGRHLLRGGGSLQLYNAGHKPHKASLQLYNAHKPHKASFQEVKKARRPIVPRSSDDFWHIGNHPQEYLYFQCYNTNEGQIACIL